MSVHSPWARISHVALLIVEGLGASGVQEEGTIFATHLTPTTVFALHTHNKLMFLKDYFYHVLSSMKCSGIFSQHLAFLSDLTFSHFSPHVHVSLKEAIIKTVFLKRVILCHNEIL